MANQSDMSKTKQLYLSDEALRILAKIKKRGESMSAFVSRAIKSLWESENR